MEKCIENINSPLFKGINQKELKTMLGCLSYRLGSFTKGEIVFCGDVELRYIGIVLSGTVDMVKEDMWGNRTALVRIDKDELFGETFACGSDQQLAVNFVAAEDCKILFLPFERVMNSCDNTCSFHHRLIVNMVGLIADKNRELINKLEVVSRRSLREKILTYLHLQFQLQNSRYFELPLGRIELADYLCVDRSALTRELVKMKNEGLIDYDRNCFRLL